MVVVVLIPVTVLAAFAEDMPEAHRVAVPAAAAAMLAGRVAELSGIPWAGLGLVARLRCPSLAKNS